MNQDDFEYRWRNTPEGIVLFLRSQEEGKPDVPIGQVCLVPALFTAVMMLVADRDGVAEVRPTVSTTSRELSLEEVLELTVLCFEEAHVAQGAIKPNSIDWFAFPPGAKERAKANLEKTTVKGPPEVVASGEVIGKDS